MDENERDGTERLEQASAQVLVNVLPQLHRYIGQMMREKYPEDPGSMAKIRVLHFLHEQSGMTSHLARAMRVSVPAMTKMIDELVEQGLVTREQDPENRRVVWLSLTEMGRQEDVRYRNRLVNEVADWLQQLGPERQTRLRESLLDLQGLLQDDLNDHRCGRHGAADHERKHEGHHHHRHMRMAEQQPQGESVV